MAVSKNTIRVQLPGGALYAPALSEAASKTGARSGLAKHKATAMTKMVDAGVALLNSGSATTITLEMRVHKDSISAVVIGMGCKSPTKKAVANLESVAEEHASSFEHVRTKSDHTVRFVV